MHCHFLHCHFLHVRLIDQDLEWLTETLIPDATEEDASLAFKMLITKAINTKATKVMNAVHLLAHADL
jgi:hypothetical protein